MLLRKPGLYIHIPFCKKKCHYCGFFSIGRCLPSLIDAFVDALKKESLFYKDSFPQPFDTIYIGGGSPTVLENRRLEEIFSHIYRFMKIEDDPEITIEANPCDINMDKARFLRSIGVNRVSLGIQSLKDEILSFLGRMHTKEIALKAYDALRKTGFENIGIDMIYAIPNQTLSDWIEDLKEIVSLEPAHISCYELTFEKKTFFWKMLKEGKIKQLDEEKKSKFFFETSSFLENSGYIHYEISNFAKNEGYISKHNFKYWIYIPYLGLGPSAHSFDGKKRRWWNLSSVRKYCNLINKGILPREEIEELSDEKIRIEKIFLGLRTRYGIEKELLFNISDETISFLVKEGLIKIKGERIIPTKKGFSLADQLSVYLV